MKRQVTAVLALTAVLAACRTTTGGTSAPAPRSTTPSTHAGSSAPKVGPLGVVAVTLRGTNGSDHVSCSHIDTEFAVYPESGSIQWTASPRDTSIDVGSPQVRAPLPGVALTPAQGILGPDQKAVVHVSGTVDAPAKQFWVWVTAPSTAGVPGRDVIFTCDGR
ncbi:hypothetical protein ACEZDB_36795 [Streptacidiphilus sp. N1-3]|uniref:Lipoprotein antigen n=1 Tax=Streptacidiphilus alkalitolerans TaxID=3342712 RepID=A0ABV6XD70_9ACTN